MLPINQDDLGEVVWHTQRLHENLDGVVFVHVHLQSRSNGVLRKKVTKCGKEPDGDYHASPFSLSTDGAGRGTTCTRSTVRLVASSISSIRPSCMSSSPRSGMRSSSARINPANVA